MDKQQKELIVVLERNADECQLQRNNSQDLLDIALHKSKQPNVFVLRNHLFAFTITALVGVGGIYMQLEKKVQYGSVMGAGVGLCIALISNAMDNSRQTRDKNELVAKRDSELQANENVLMQAAQKYREEEEIGWLTFALGISKTKFLALREWMSDPRRTMKDAVLDSTDIFTINYLSQPLSSLQLKGLTVEREYRTLRSKMFSKEVQIKRDEFMLRVASKHKLIQEKELANDKNRSEKMIATTSVVGGTTAGLAAGAAAAGIGSGVASALGGSRDTANLVGALGGAAVVLGVGVLAAGAITDMMRKSEQERRKREEQNYRESFIITNNILEIITKSKSSSNNEKINAARKALQKLDLFKSNELKSQDEPMKEYVNVLRFQVKSFLGEPQDDDILGHVSKFLGGLFG